MTKLTVEINQQFAEAQSAVQLPDGSMVAFTPPLDDQYWAFRVPVSDKQAIVGFPKFFTIGIGFQHEDEDWNTNLPYTCDAEEIYHHIKVNKGDRSISKKTCVQAIQLIQDVAAEYMR